MGRPWALQAADQNTTSSAFSLFLGRQKNIPSDDIPTRRKRTRGAKKKKKNVKGTRRVARRRVLQGRLSLRRRRGDRRPRDPRAGRHRLAAPSRAREALLYRRRRHCCAGAVAAVATPLGYRCRRRLLPRARLHRRRRQAAVGDVRPEMDLVGSSRRRRRPRYPHLGDDRTLPPANPRRPASHRVGLWYACPHRMASHPHSCFF